MEKYNYKKEMIKNIKKWILENGILCNYNEDNYDDIFNWLYDELWDKDCITGNGTYGYASETQCGEYVGTNFDLYFEAAREFNDFPTEKMTWTKERPAQHMDATIRCYLLGECISQAIHDLILDIKIKS